MMQWFIFVINPILTFVGCLVLILSLVLLLECIASIFKGKNQQNISELDNYSLAILIPAHNEETEIKATLEPILAQIKPQDRVIVIADNCSDRTAAIAKDAGVMVIERQDQEKRGKGYALDYGLQFLSNNPTDVVILIDADCFVHPQAISFLTQHAIATEKPVQAIYLMEQPQTATPKDAISAFAFKVKNLVRPLGLANLGQPCLLTGTGMAFPWSVISNVDLASGNIVEDMKLGLDLALLGYSPQFCPEAEVMGRLPQQQQAATTQRTRWEHGHLQTLINYVPRLIINAIKQKRLDLLVTALDLAIPPLSLFVSLWFAVTAFSIVSLTFGVSLIPTLILSLAGIAIITAILVSWAKFGRKQLPLKILLSIPLYILWKIPLYFKFILQRQQSWIRTERDKS